MKPGYKSTEFWLALVAAVVGAVLASGVVPDESGFAKLLGLATTVLASLGYTAGRSLVKTGQAKADALKAAASVPLPKE